MAGYGLHIWMASQREAVRHMACVVQSFKCAVVYVRHMLSSGCSVQWQLIHASVVTASLSIIDPAGQVCVPHRPYLWFALALRSNMSSSMASTPAAATFLSASSHGPD